MSWRGIGRTPVDVAHQLGFAHVRDIEDDKSTVPVTHVEPVSISDRMMAAVCRSIPARRLPAADPLPRHPPTSDLFWPGRILEVENHCEVAHISLHHRGEVRVPFVRGKTVHTLFCGFEKCDLARLDPIRNVKDLEPPLPPLCSSCISPG